MSERLFTQQECDEVRDELLSLIGIINAGPEQNFSNEVEREQALESMWAWARDFLTRTTR